MRGKPGISKRSRLWMGASASVLLAASLAACSGEGEGGEGEGATDAQNTVGVSSYSAEGGEGEGGEGEGGEGDAAEVSLATDDVAYLTQLALVEGHLTVGTQLYLMGTEHSEHAAGTHMKHPGDELYADLLPVFEARGVNGFSDQLTALSSAVEGGASADEVQTIFAGLRDDIHASRGSAGDMSFRTRLDVIHSLILVAAEEYAIGVVDGHLENAHEYQDAWGFTTMAKNLLGETPAGDRDQYADVIAAVEAQFDVMAPAWPSIMPPEMLETDASLLYGAAANIEIAGLDVQ